jgi:L-amino acid N-acyltransferase YncA
VNDKVKIRQQTFTAESAMERRQKRKLNIARRRQRQKVSYYVPDIPGWEVDNDPTAKSYLNTYLRPAVRKDVPIIAEIYNQWVLHSFIPEDQEEVLEQSFRSLLETAHRESYPFIVAIKGDSPVDRSCTAPEDILGFALAEGCAGFGGGFGGLSGATAFIHVYVDRNCLRKGVGGRLLDQLLKRLSALYVSHFDRRIWVNPDQDPLYEQMPKRFHQILARRPVDGAHDPDIMWLDAFMNKYGFSEAHRTHGIARKSQAMTESNGTGFMEVVTYQHEAESATRVQR